jgi:predicted AAA+ superfamily ATPase
MFRRNIEKELEKWSMDQHRKPLVLRGARQVGKTTLVHQFAEKFDHYIYLNLELPEDRKPFEDFQNLETLLKTLFFLKDVAISKRSQTLIFIDEIQEVPKALNLLRFFHEEAPEIPVIAAGSLLETIFNSNISFPVGRVTFLIVRPVSFEEFLAAISEQKALDQITTIPLNNFAHQKLLQLFHMYALIGGMPEIIKLFSESRDFTDLKTIYDSLITSYSDDIEKYAQNKTQTQHIRHAFNASFFEAGTRIKFHGFGKSSYGSKEMGEALRTLEKALLIQLVYPTTNTLLPIFPELKKSPRLQLLDTGLMNAIVGIQKEIIGTKDLHSIYQGKVIEHLVGQEILAKNHFSINALSFWVREKNSSTAEVDYVININGKLIPIEVKSGKEGKLKSLHLFMENALSKFAIRLYSGELSLTKALTPSGKYYHLLNLPYYLTAQIPAYVDWLEVLLSNENE